MVHLYSTVGLQSVSLVHLFSTVGLQSVSMVHLYSTVGLQSGYGCQGAGAQIHIYVYIRYHVTGLSQSLSPILHTKLTLILSTVITNKLFD